MVKRTIQHWLSYIPMIIILFGLLLVNLHTTVKSFTVESRKKNTTLYVSGVIRPLSLYSVLSPVDGIAVKINTPYNQWVKKGDVLYIVDSQKFADDVRQTLEELTKSTTMYQNTLFQYNGNTELFKRGLISEVTYKDNAQQLQNTKFDLLELKARMEKLLQRVGMTAPDFQNMTDERIQEILKNPIRLVKIKAPEEGFLLFPSKIFNNPETDTAIVRGSNVKEGQTVALIGNMTGINLEINVDETELNKFYIGEQATISGTAFPNIKLKGTIQNINRQANSSQGDSVPTYTMSVVVPRLNEKQRKILSVGMSAEVALTTINPPEIWIPIDAIIERNGQFFVKKINNQDDINEVSVMPGTTDESLIQILKGLSSGDRIVISN